MIKNSDPALYQSFLIARERHSQGDLAGAEAIYSRLLALDPADDEVLFFFGHLQVGKGAVDLGLECLRLAQQLKPGNPQIPYTIGVVLQEAGRLGEAICAYRAALEVKPDFREALENACAAYYDQENYAFGLEMAQRALAVAPESALAIRGAANCLTALGRRAEALMVLEQGIGVHPAHPELRIHLAWELMANGRFDQGWRALEWRNSRQGKNDPPPRYVPCPRWNGEDPRGKTILVYGEQGVGDEIMYAPFVLGILRSGGRCLLECEPRLERLFARAFPECILLHREEREQIGWRSGMPWIDYAVSALSLPLYFQHPLAGSAFLTAEPERVDYWRRRLAELGSGLKVGVSWRGGADAKARKIRSIPMELFANLIEAPATFVSLQYGSGADEIAAVSPQLRHFAEIDPLKDLDEFCAFVAALDAVVSVDNSTVHLAGALGVKTLMLLPAYSEWRWGNAASGETPWYRSVEMVRQRQASTEGWQEVLEKARVWLSEAGPAVPLAMEIRGRRAAVLRPAGIKRSALLVGDRQYWHHWGNAASSLGLHAGLRECFDAIDVVPVGRLLRECPLPTDATCLDSDEFWSRFEGACADIVAKVKAADCIVIDGGGWVQNRAIALLTLYVGCMAVRRFGKRGVLINATRLSEIGPVPAWDAYLAHACGVLDVVARDASSLEYYRSYNASTRLGFDCLPRFFQGNAPAPLPAKKSKLVLAGIGPETLANLAPVVHLTSWLQREGYAIEFLVGAKGPLAPQEIDSVDGVAKALRGAGVPFTLLFSLGEQEWLETLGSAALMISEDFHHILAAAFFRIPFLVPAYGAMDLTDLLADLAIDKEMVAMTREQGANDAMARKLLREGAPEISSGQWKALNARIEQNFSAL